MHEGQSRSVQEQGWLKGGQPGDVWQMEAELKAGAMGFEEGYVSKVEAKKWKGVSVNRLAPSSPPKLANSLPPTPMLPDTMLPDRLQRKIRPSSST